MTWYPDLISLMRVGLVSSFGILMDVKDNVLLSLDREDLFQIILRRIDYKAPEIADEKVDANNNEFKEAYRKIYFPAILAETILFKIASVIEDELLDKYELPFSKNVDHFPCSDALIDTLRKDKNAMLAKNDFFAKYPELKKE